MGDSRSKNVRRNITFAFLRGVINTVLPFVTRTVTLYLLGVDYLGVGTLFKSILSMLNMTELGLSSAITYLMYKPIAEGDFKEVSSILCYFRRIYRIIGVTILAIGTLIVPLIPILIKGEPPANLNIYVLFYIYLINTVISYFFAGYRHCLLTANQRADILSKVTMTIYVFNNVGQIIALVLTRNYYVYAIVPIVGTLLTNISVTIITRRKYPEILCKGEVSDTVKSGVKKRISGLFGTKLNSLVVHQADILVISAFLGLTILTEYGNYYFVLNAVCAFTSLFFSSFTASIGNKLVKDSIDVNYAFFINFNGLNSWLVGLCSAFMMVLFQPFMRIWVGESLMQPMLFVVLFVVYFYSFEIQRAILTFKDAAGLWYEDRKRPYVTMVFNIVSNVILVQIIGVYGVVVSSIIAFLISIPWTNFVLFNTLFKKSFATNLLRMGRELIVNATLVCACYLISYLVCTGIDNGIILMAARAIVTFFVFNFGYLLIYRKDPVMKYWINVLQKMVHREKRSQN